MKKLLLIPMLMLCLTLKAQDKIEITGEDYQNTGVEMADLMRSNGKIYVLVGIIGIVLGGILVYLIQTDRKITRLEQQYKELS
ncbi:hypothetical protein ADIS_1834 [Lunatimonas lonarensis]|uniref:CcmD family protein n=1 Tax=Lunatimonas lonarensis TaxID=1232681 RepID=R7ZU20_9BACT|nr:hypothetical protein [Lunatimonas lonarensis]EON77615.1 hypothetical protein ADIS_1834 [Lunatimonas lonarensis]